MERWIDAFPWLVWLLAAVVAGVVTMLGLIYWWLQHPVEDDESRTF
jgi:hypothetical protein